ncbi:MAG: DUF362 domain-containing protein [Candidatus Lokiarchaeota archaeon]|nr:DUF362 domain-containing protein [Candidatus Lokiarchaeota archaeon]
MKSDVYYFTARSQSHEQSMSKVKGPLSLKKLGFEEKIRSGDKVVVKTHFGALENTRYLRPSYLRFLCDYIKELDGIPSLAESCGWGLPEHISGKHTEYSGRANEEEYLSVALQHGFTSETMGAPILMLDGVDGTDYEIQKISGKNFKEVLVGGRLREFDFLVLATHFKGHSGTGFGGAIKNLGIGCVSKGGKVQAHMSKKFSLKYEKCVLDCEKCVDVCPTKALSKGDDRILKKDWDKCRYCYLCRSVCEQGVFDIGNSTNEEFITQMVDNAKGVVEYFGDNKMFYINYAIDITWQCDCGSSDVPFVPDIGILSSLDPVALDQACVDLTHESMINPHSILSVVKNLPKNANNEWFSYIPRFDPSSGKLDLNEDGNISKHWEIQLKVAEELGLGSRDYNLINVDIESSK